MVRVSDFDRAFTEGERYQDQYEGTSAEMVVERRVIGELLVPTGEIVACDPLTFFPEIEGFAVRAPTGRYPVVLSIAHIKYDNKDDEEDQRVACAMLQISPARPQRWDLAIAAGQDVGTLGEDEFFGYGVDSGTGCFMDKAAVAALDRKHHEEPEYWQKLIGALDETYVHTRSWGDITLDPETKLNLIMFSSGWGDGAYPSFWGYDDNGNVACLVTDFGVLPGH